MLLDAKVDVRSAMFIDIPFLRLTPIGLNQRPIYLPSLP